MLLCTKVSHTRIAAKKLPPDTGQMRREQAAVAKDELHSSNPSLKGVAHVRLSLSNWPQKYTTAWRRFRQGPFANFRLVFCRFKSGFLRGIRHIDITRCTFFLPGRQSILVSGAVTGQGDVLERSSFAGRPVAAQAPAPEASDRCRPAGPVKTAGPSRAAGARPARRVLPIRHFQWIPRHQ